MASRRRRQRELRIHARYWYRIRDRQENMLRAHDRAMMRLAHEEVRLGCDYISKAGKRGWLDA